MLPKFTKTEFENVARLFSSPFASEVMRYAATHADTTIDAEVFLAHLQEFGKWKNKQAQSFPQTAGEVSQKMQVLAVPLSALGLEISSPEPHVWRIRRVVSD